MNQTPPTSPSRHPHRLVLCFGLSLLTFAGCDLHENPVGRDGETRAKLEAIDKKLDQLGELEKKLSQIEAGLDSLKAQVESNGGGAAMDPKKLAEALRPELKAQIEESLQKMPAAPVATTRSSGREAGKPPEDDGGSGPIPVTVKQYDGNKRMGDR